MADVNQPSKRRLCQVRATETRTSYKISRGLCQSTQQAKPMSSTGNGDENLLNEVDFHRGEKSMAIEPAHDPTRGQNNHITAAAIRKVNQVEIHNDQQSMNTEFTADPSRVPENNAFVAAILKASKGEICEDRKSWTWSPQMSPFHI